ncbi:UDP-N-acetylglucosamine 2-epimerase [Ulvibacter antarcticus]|uniref:UDP-N-acetylglucosamine 2-epimerase (Hydrolysing) n=1 Tax=Ulvibacter antarcticus TaxID=442714 RepID=A0A3L9YB79_9FLAO|nr:UDP-N-acetylglucosamine 2-epimerase [Ulvibacter antarcticus]RMA57986.1 UDP-N-acetylglucosamine 2-epimerase (hydrolysing) [Ulvibacter antarcticus]
MKKITFLTGTRADFGKIKSLLQILDNDPDFEPHIFATGMHLQVKYGYTVKEIEKSGFKLIHTFDNHTSQGTMDLNLAKTIEGFSSYVRELKPDLIVVHGDRVETLAGAIVGALNNILVAHIEGGEISGTVDELIRHSVSKLSHLHFVSNASAARRLEQMGELAESIHEIGSPDVDIMFSGNLPELLEVKRYYEIPFDRYNVAMFHPVTTEYEQMEQHASNFVDALLADDSNYVIIYPNNDLGSDFIFKAYERLKGNSRFRIFPSIRFEYFLTLLKKADFMIGNSSAGIREAPYYHIPTVNIGTRQQNRSLHDDIIHSTYNTEDICSSIEKAKQLKVQQADESFGEGNSATLFLEALKKEALWELSNQKQFRDRI